MGLLKCGKSTLGLIVLVILFRFASSAKTNKENQEIFKQSIQKALIEGSESVYDFRNRIEDKNVVIFLGSTKSGKSTLVNYLLGTKLLAYPSEMTGLKIKEYGQSTGPKIGTTSLSKTAIPGVYPMQGQPDTVAVDSPGFDDNRGAAQNVVNAVYINQVKHAKTVRFVMVSDVHEIMSDNVNIFLNALEQMHELLASCNEAHPHISIIITKVPSSYSQQNVVDLLKEKILNDELKISKCLIKNVVDNSNLLGILRKPAEEGLIRDDLDVNIKGAIAKSEAMNMKEHGVIFTLSDKAKEALLEVYPEYVDSNYFESEVGKVLRNFVDFSKEKWIFASYDEELKGNKSELQALKLSVEKERSMSRKNLNDIQKSLQILLGSSVSNVFANNFEFIVILDQSSIIEDQYKKVIHKNYEKSLDNVLYKINDLLQKIEAELIERRENHIEFPSERNFMATANTITHGVMYKVYGITSAVYEKVSHTVGNMIEGIPVKESLPEAIGTVLHMASGEKSESLEMVCSAAKQAAQVAVKYIPEGLTIGGIAGVGAGGSAAYLVYEEIYGSRFEVRTAQGRSVYSWL